MTTVIDQSTARDRAEASSPGGEPTLPCRIWTGRVYHHRSEPTTHRVDVRIWWADLDLDRIDDTLDSLRLLGTAPGRPLRFRRADYFGDPDTDLATSVRDLVGARTGSRPSGPIRLVGHLRTAGWCFNPIVLYLCHGSDGGLEHVVADVTNTPWKERHQYVLPASGSGPDGFVDGVEMSKALHVSPFMPMDQRYRFDMALDATRLRFRVTTLSGSGDARHSPFRAGVDLAARPMTDAHLAGVLVRHPLLTLRVSTSIHTHALRLWRKGVRYQPHPHRSAHEERPT